MAIDLNTNFYLCTICFKTSEAEEECHTLMIPVSGVNLKDQQRRPLEEDGQLVTHAPRWFISASKEQAED